MHTGSVDDILHTRCGTSARGENDEDLSSPNPEQDPDSNVDDGDPIYYYDDILDHQQMDDGHYKFQVEWNTGEITLNKTSKFYCNTTDLGCYLLPWSFCAPEYGRNDPTSGRIQTNSEDFAWFKQYASHVKQKVRQKILRTLSNYPKVVFPYTAMHFRRGDSGLPRYPFRRYAAVSEYIEVGNVLENDTIVLLTDDISPIEEVTRFHPNYNWIYTDRPRNNGSSAGFDSHVPSGGPVSYFFAIQAEIRLASRCSKFVYGKSGFLDIILDQMQAVGNHNVSRYYVDTAISKSEAQSISGRNRGSILIEQIFSNEARKGETPSINASQS